VHRLLSSSKFLRGKHFHWEDSGADVLLPLGILFALGKEFFFKIGRNRAEQNSRNVNRLTFFSQGRDMMPPLWLRSLRRVFRGNFLPQTSSRPQVETLEDRTVLSGKNTLPDLARSGSSDFLAETRHSDLTTSLTREIESGRPTASFLTPAATSSNGGGGS